jgi:glyoxylase-like metal-dependent hydrolase (beta-lactamase superfamily II)
MVSDTKREERAGTGMWTEPGSYEIVPGVFRVPLPMPGDALRAVNVYVLAEPGGYTLIDGGWAIAEARQALERGMGLIGARPEQIRRVLVTHAHRDHYTLAVMLRREFGATVGIGWGERHTIRTLTSHTRHVQYAPLVALLTAAGAGDLLRRIERKIEYVDPREDGWESPDLWLQPGCVAVGDAELRIIPTPGHTIGHVVFADTGRGLLFAGDHVLPHITPSIGVEGVASPSPLKSYLESLRTVRALPDLMLLPAHGPVAPSSHARVHELLMHHDARLAAIRGIASAGPATAAEIAGQLGWTRRDRSFGELDDFNQMLAVGETVAHLKVLVSAGLVSTAAEGLVTLYSAGSAFGSP